MIKSAFAIVFLTRAVIVISALWIGYEIVTNPSEVGDGFGRFFGSIVSGFNAASE